MQEDARLPHRRLLRPGRTHRVRLCLRAARIPLSCAATRTSSSFPTTASVLPRDAPHRLYEVVGTSFWNSMLPHGALSHRRPDPAAGDLGRDASSRSWRWDCAPSGRPRAASRKSSSARRRAPHAASAVVPRDVEHVMRIQVVQEDLERRASSWCPTRGFCDDDAENLLANARARDSSRSQRHGRDRQLPGAHAARQDAADRAPSAGARCAAPCTASSRCSRASRQAPHAAARLVSAGACGACPAPRWRIAWRAACARCRSNSARTKCRRAMRSRTDLRFLPPFMSLSPER